MTHDDVDGDKNVQDPQAINSNIVSFLWSYIFVQMATMMKILRTRWPQKHRLMAFLSLSSSLGGWRVLQDLRCSSPLFPLIVGEKMNIRIKEILPNEKVLAEYQSVGADLNVMPYCSQFIPMEVLFIIIIVIFIVNMIIIIIVIPMEVLYQSLSS